MTKPHEEASMAHREWAHVVIRADCGRALGCAYGNTEEEQNARGALFAAAPDMARELRHLVRLLEPKEREGGFDVPGLATLNGARAALKKAGVL